MAWIAKDKDGQVYLYMGKPTLDVEKGDFSPPDEDERCCLLRDENVEALDAGEWLTSEISPIQI